MCMVADAAMTMVNKAIDLAEKTGDRSYYLDYIAVHKLLFLCQHKMLHDFGVPMFEEEIHARNCGPYIDGMNFLTVKRDVLEITKRFEKDEIVPITYIAEKVMDAVLGKYCYLSTEDIVKTVKDNVLYKSAIEKDEFLKGGKPLISKDEMKESEDASIQSIIVDI